MYIKYICGLYRFKYIYIFISLSSASKSKKRLILVPKSALQQVLLGHLSGRRLQLFIIIIIQLLQSDLLIPNGGHLSSGKRSLIGPNEVTLKNLDLSSSIPCCLFLQWRKNMSTKRNGMNRPTPFNRNNNCLQKKHIFSKKNMLGR